MGKRRGDGVERWQELGFASYRDWIIDCDRIRRAKKKADKSAEASAASAASAPIPQHHPSTLPVNQLTTMYESMAVAVQEAQPIITISPKSPQTACLAVPNFEMPTRAQLGIAAVAPEQTSEAFLPNLALPARKADREQAKAALKAARAERRSPNSR